MRKKRDSREKIVNSAITLFSRKGFDGASIRQISIESGMSVPMIYYYFNNKKELYLYILEVHMDKVSVGIEKVLSSKGDYIDVFNALIDYLSDSFKKNLGIFYMVFQEIFFKGEFVDVLTKKYLVKMHSQLASFLETGAAKGIFRPHLNFHMCANSIISIILIYHTQEMSYNILSEHFNDKEIYSLGSLKLHIYELLAED